MLEKTSFLFVTLKSNTNIKRKSKKYTIIKTIDWHTYHRLCCTFSVKVRQEVIISTERVVFRVVTSIIYFYGPSRTWSIAQFKHVRLKDKLYQVILIAKFILKPKENVTILDLFCYLWCMMLVFWWNIWNITILRLLVFICVTQTFIMALLWK